MAVVSLRQPADTISKFTFQGHIKSTRKYFVSGSLAKTDEMKNIKQETPVGVGKRSQWVF